MYDYDTVGHTYSLQVMVSGKLMRNLIIKGDDFKVLLPEDDVLGTQCSNITLRSL